MRVPVKKPILPIFMFVVLECISIGLIGFGQREEFRPNSLILQVHAGASKSQLDALNAANSATVRRRLLETKEVIFFEIELPDQANLDAAILAYEHSPVVHRARRNAVVWADLASVRIPNDPGFSSQWHLDAIDAPELWRWETGSGNVTIAVVDTGVDVDHPDLVDNLDLDNAKNFRDDENEDGDAPVDDDDDHGTFTAGLIGAVGDNGIGATGVMWDVNLLPLKLLSPIWVEGQWVPTEADFIQAYGYAKDQGAKIINNSWNGIHEYSNIASAIESLQDNDILFVFSAGNDGRDVDTTNWEAGDVFPCKHHLKNVICVAAVDEAGNLAGFSNLGRRGVHLAAPGVAIYSTTNGGGTAEGASADPATVNYCGTTCRNSGTSWAAPLVSGVAGMMKSVNPDLTYWQIKENLLLSSQPVSTGSLVGVTHTGRMLNANLAPWAFGDSFDDSPASQRLFLSNPTKSRWAVPQNGYALCDPVLRKVDDSNGVDTDDVAIDAEFTGSTAMTIAGYWAEFPPENQDQTLVIRVTSRNEGTDIMNEMGRISVGLVENAGITNQTCGTLGTYKRMSFGDYVFAGIDLKGPSDRSYPFIVYDTPLTDLSYSPYYLDLRGVKNLSIAVTITDESVTLYASNSDNGTPLITTGSGDHFIQVNFPYSWDLGTNAVPVLMYYGSSGETGTHHLYIREFVSLR